VLRDCRLRDPELGPNDRADRAGGHLTLGDQLKNPAAHRIGEYIERVHAGKISRVAYISQILNNELGVRACGAFTIESVAARAGVAKSTIYRHWPDKISLIGDAFEIAHEHAVPSVEGLTARESLQRLLHHVAEVVVDSTFSACIPALIEGAERDPRLRKFRHRYSALRRQSLTALISQGVADGEFHTTLDPELAAQALLGPIFYQRLMTSEPFDPNRVHDLIDMVLGP
jgi:TetR/AcrR family transcriptional regulator of autoinduction and epiphytic fitness